MDAGVVGIGVLRPFHGGVGTPWFEESYQPSRQPAAQRYNAPMWVLVGKPLSLSSQDVVTSVPYYARAVSSVVKQNGHSIAIAM
jgi:hypothetical protein